MIEPSPKLDFTAKEIFEMSNIFQDREVSRWIKKINDDYLYWDKVKYFEGQSIEKTTQMWKIAKFYRRVKYLEISFGKYKFNYLITDYIQQALHHFDMNIGGFIGSKGILPEEHKTRYLVSSIMEEAISSSQMEGANTTRKKAKEMLRKEIKPKSKSEQMILNNYETIKYITKNKNDELSPERLLYIHQLISRNTLDDVKDEGKFRNNNDIHIVNYTNSEVVHTPPNYKEIEALITHICDFFNKEGKQFIHPLIKAIVIHFMLGWIHPFTDGNGRTARALFYWYLLKKGYWLTEYLSISKIIKDSKTQYERAYLHTEMDDNDLSYFITYHFKVMEKAFDTLKNYIQKKQKENRLTSNFIKIPNVNERQAQLLKWVYDTPDIVFSVKELENRFVISNYTARTDLKGLVDLGFLDIVQVNKIKQNFVKSFHFDRLIEKYVKW